VCTLGPATSSVERIRELVDAGMDVARLNMSHGSHEEPRLQYDMVRAASDATGHGVGIIADLQGPKIRLETFTDGKVKLSKGSEFVITTRDVEGDATICGTTYKGLPGDVTEGDPILVDDGKLRLRVMKVDDTDVTTVVEVAGKVSDHKGLNLPGVAVSVPALSDKDKDDLRWALRTSVDFIALSFVRSAADADDVRAIMREEGVSLPIIAKIEKPQAIDNLDEIVEAFDAFMVARGDLGVECPLEDVPFLQKRVIDKARRNAKPVIVATQMLESMITNPRPTRAEASDVANAVLDGADAVMLSGETSVGEYPLVTVQTMARIIESTEEHGLERILPLGTKPRTQGGAITLAAAEVAEFVAARFLCVFTESGDSVRRMVRLRNKIPVLAFTPEPGVRSRLALSWGVETFLVPRVTTTDELMHQVDDVLLGLHRIERGEKVVVIAGSPPGIPGSTNDMRVHIMGDAIGGAAPAYQQFG
jgi:pyruvate kinase